MTTTTSRQDVQRAVRAKRGIILDVGCGPDKQPGAIGMDRHDAPGVDVIWDYNDIPWPFEDESVITIVASHVVEHIPRRDGSHFIDWMNECWRVLKPGGQLAIITPYGLSRLFVQDPTNVHPVNEKTFWYFDGDLSEMHGGAKIVYWCYYKPRPWKIEANFFSAEGQLEVSLRKRLAVPDSWLGQNGSEATS